MSAVAQGCPLRLALLLSLVCMAVSIPRPAGADEPAPLQTMTVPGVGIEMVLIPGGEAPMGSDSGRTNEQPVHTVRIDSFWIGRYEVTQQQWATVMGANPSRSRNCPQCPVESVSWEESRVFLERAAALSGLALRFPTEAEWEFAAAGGQARQQWPGTDRPDEAGEFAWYSGNFAGRTKTAGTRLPNLFGLFDMGGNVAEWCADWYGEKYDDNAAGANPSGPASGRKRVVRGGSWLGGPMDTRSSWRTGRSPGTRSPAIGLRVAAEEGEKK